MTTNQQTTAPSHVQADDPIVEIRDASVTFDEGTSYVLDDVSMDIQRNEIVGVVGESGSGKSMLASCILDAIPDPGVLSGSIQYNPTDGDPVDVLELSSRELKELRWEDISMVFQGAMSSFNPTMRIEGHFRETLDAHEYDIESGIGRAYELLEDLYLDPERVLGAYPHELSGGMRQRALIALSLVLEPDILVMDEPTAALDLLMQRSILLLLDNLQQKYDLTMLFITHDLPLVASLADRLAVMYAFDLIEIGEREDIIKHPAHPYTRALLNSTPNLDAPLEEMEAIGGSSPAPINVPSGCRYHPRCPLATEACRNSDPHFHETQEDHVASCFHWEKSMETIPLNYERGDVEASGDGGAS